MAGFSAAELKQMAVDAGLEGITVKKYFITHLGIERSVVDARPGPRPDLKGIKARLMHWFYRR